MALYYGIISRMYITELYYGIILWNDMMKLYYGITLPHYTKESYYDLKSDYISTNGQRQQLSVVASESVRCNA